MQLLGDLLKVKDASGHQHGSDGKFTSNGDGGGSLKSAGGESYSTARNHDQHIVFHDTEGGQQNFVGHATPHEKTGGFKAAYEREDHPAKPLGIHGSVESAMRAIAEYHEKSGHTASGKGKPNDSDADSASLASLKAAGLTTAYRHLADHHESTQTESKKMKTIGDLLAPKTTELGLLLTKSAIKPLATFVAPQTDRLQKRRVVQRIAKYAAPKDTFEDLISQVREPVIAAVPCEAPPSISGSPYREGSHWLSVIGTDADRALVHCDQENKTWSVPYEVVDNEVITKDPIEVQQTFEPLTDEGQGLDSSDLDSSEPLDASDKH